MGQLEVLAVHNFSVLSCYKLTLDPAGICVANNTFWRGSFRPLGETKLEIKMEKRLRVTHQFNYSVVHNLIGKVNKQVALRLQLDSMALRMLLSATVLEVSLLKELLFQQLCKWLWT